MNVTSAEHLGRLRVRWESAVPGTQQWDDAAAEYAATREGARTLGELQVTAVAQADIELDVAIETALNRGAKSIYDARIARIAARSVPLVRFVGPPEGNPADKKIGGPDGPAPGRIGERR